MLCTSLSGPRNTEERTPDWFDDVAGWLVTMAEGRFGFCRMLLWLRPGGGDSDGGEGASVVMPHPKYPVFEWSLPSEIWGAPRSWAFSIYAISRGCRSARRNAPQPSRRSLGRRADDVRTAMR